MHRRRILKVDPTKGSSPRNPNFCNTSYFQAKPVDVKLQNISNQNQSANKTNFVDPFPTKGAVSSDLNLFHIRNRALSVSEIIDPDYEI